MVLSWALTEVIRYTFYATSLVGWEPAPLVWARYSTFFVLYPTGAGSEALVNFATLPVSVARGGSWISALPMAQWNAYALMRGVLFVAWWPGGYLSFLSAPYWLLRACVLRYSRNGAPAFQVCIRCIRI
jgi:very-long-chain (3R)-3-hydroxyacyl-CoA dehydratase